MVNEGEVRQLMSAIDLNRDGSLQDSEFLATMIDWPAVMKEKAGEGGDGGEGGESEWDTYVEAAFSRLDRDGDGYIDLDEILAELPPAYLSPASASSSSVNSMGSGGSSSGGASGASAVGSRDDATLPPSLEEAEKERVAEAKRMLREADEDGDGRISRQEFSNLLRHSTPDELSLYDSRLGASSADEGGGGDGAGNGAAAAAAETAAQGQPSDARR
jgi:calcium-dependent protein kinase